MSTSPEQVTDDHARLTMEELEVVSMIIGNIYCRSSTIGDRIIPLGVEPNLLYKAALKLNVMVTESWERR